eukprot:scaffold7698_cov444-Prasinococcus_capsulatus_cf.AAC.1
MSFPKAVPPSAPRESPQRLYWGYTTRVASSFSNVFTSCPFKGGRYDYVIGTSEHGSTLDDWRHQIKSGGVEATSIDAAPDDRQEDNVLFDSTHAHLIYILVCICRRELKYDHLLIVFGGVYGLEASCGADPDNTFQPPTALLDEQFHCYLNLCPTQGSRTIRTEEAVLMCLTALQPVIHPPVA